MIEMLINYIKVAYRNLIKYKSYSLINIVGLSVGLASCLLILLFVRNELSYDRFHSKASQIYQVPWRFHVGVNEFESALAPCPLAEAMLSDFPEVLAATRLYSISLYGGNVYVRYEDKQYSEKNFVWADSTIFDVFDITVLTGDAKTALNSPNSVMITPETAKKYFGDVNPIGKMLKFEDGTLYKVTAIAEDLPVNSHFHFDFMASFSSLKKSRDTDWYDTAVLTYVVLPEDYPSGQLEAKLDRFSREHAEPVIKMITGLAWDEFLANGYEYTFFLEPLTQIHLYSKVENNLEPGGNIKTVYIFSAIAIIILFVACINFINLAISRSARRTREIGVRKAVGSTRMHLVVQFLIETIVLCFIAVVVALIVVVLVLPVFSQLLGRAIPFTLFQNVMFIPLLLLSVVFIGSIAGSYPALVLSSFKPALILKGKYMAGTHGGQFRNILVIFQFVASIALIIGTLVIYNQLKYFQTKELGFDKDQIVVIQNAESLTNREAFKNSLLTDSNIKSATFTDCVPQMRLEVKVFERPQANQNYTLITILSDYDFQKTYDVKMAEGRFFDKTRPADAEGVILNKAAIKAMNIENWQQEDLYLLGRNRTRLKIIGVFEDFHLASLHYDIKPMASVMIKERTAYLLSVKLRGGNIQKTLKHIENQWVQYVPDQPLDYVFYDDEFGKMYKSEIQAGHVLSVFSVLAIFVACLGLFGIVSFTTMQRTKEIGIRKVLGSSVVNVVLLLIKDFLKWILVANVIAWPLAWYFMNNWLENFAYRINIGIFTFIFSGTILLAVALITISWQVIRAAQANPVDSIKYE